MTNKIFGHKLKGSALLLTTIVTMTMIAAIAVSLVKLNSVASSALISNKDQMQAQQYALSEASLLRAVRYGEMNSMACSLVRIMDGSSSTKFLKTIIVDAGTGVPFRVSGGSTITVNRKTATIQIFHEDDQSSPVIEIKVPHYIRESKPYLPVGAIIAWAGTGVPAADYGTFFECSNQIIPSDYSELQSVLNSGRTPNFADKFLVGTDDVGQLLDSTSEYGLPNITGAITKPNVVYGSMPTVSLTNNPFCDELSSRGDRMVLTKKADGTVDASVSSTIGTVMNFDASKYNSLYKSTLTDKVEVPSVKVRFFIKAE